MQFKIPFHFIVQKVTLSWTDIKYGFDRQLISPDVAIKKACQILLESENPSKEDVELAGLTLSDRVYDIIVILAYRENRVDDQIVRDKWLYVILSWIYENKEKISDPLSVVEEVYSDFDYPEQISSLIRYMPMVGPDLGSKEKNLARLFDYWADYLERSRKQFGIGSSTID